MNTKDSILEQLKSSKFSDFAAGIENTSTYFKENGYDEQLFEHALSVYTYHLDHKHDEIEEAYSKIGNNLQLFFICIKTHESVSSNWFTEGQIEGLSTFLTNYKEEKLDLSKYFMVTGFTYQIVAHSCENALEITDRNEFPEECEGLEIFQSVFDELWKIQMTVQGIIRDTTSWDDLITVYLFNSALYRADLEGQSRMMAGLSAHENNADIQQEIVVKYIDSLDREMKILEAKKEEIAGVKETMIEWFPA